ncbi:MAG: DUF5615 family PIN-like protein [Planctomycetes bacterium]|nr:DUF5615 family PIN-like protein [Planctomycetota bacterium]
MKLWIDAQISPSIAPWIGKTQGIEAVPLRDLGLRDAADREIFFAARAAGAVILTKDADFSDLLLRHGAPPQIVWLTVGNSSNARLKDLLTRVWPRVAALIDAGEALIELGEPR